MQSSPTLHQDPLHTAMSSLIQDITPNCTILTINLSIIPTINLSIILILSNILTISTVTTGSSPAPCSPPVHRGRASPRCTASTAPTPCGGRGVCPAGVLRTPSHRRPGAGRPASVRCVTTVSAIPAGTAAVPAGPTPAPASRSEPRTSSVPPVTTTASARPLPPRPSRTRPGASLSTPRS